MNRVKPHLPRFFYFTLERTEKEKEKYEQVFLYPGNYHTLWCSNDRNMIELSDDAKTTNENLLNKNPNYYTQLKIAAEPEKQRRSLHCAAKPVIIGESVVVKKKKTRCECKAEYKLPWANKISCADRTKIVKICAELWGENKKLEMARELMICIAMETGETFNPAIGYPNATGLIQLTDIAITEMNKTRHKGKYNGGINFTKDNLKEMTVERQLDFVKYYFQMNLDNGKTVSNALDMYMCIWCPAAVGKDNNYVCYQRGTSAYTGNLSIDGETYDEKTHKIKATSKKGHITKGDLLPRYKEKKWNGELMMWMNISKCSESPSEEETPKDGMVSKYLSYTEAVSSDTATRHKLDNSPTKEHLENIKALGYNIYDKLYEQFNGNIIPSSVYRSDAVNAEIKGASTTSQHLNGEAMDIDNISPTKNKNIYKYIINNLEYDQIIWEYGDEENPEWVHVSYKKDGNNRYKQTRAIRDENKQTKYIDFNIKLDK